MEEIIMDAVQPLIVTINAVLAIVCAFAFWKTKNAAFALLCVGSGLGFAINVVGPDFSENSLLRTSEILLNSAGIVALCFHRSSMPTPKN